MHAARVHIVKRERGAGTKLTLDADDRLHQAGCLQRVVDLKFLGGVARSRRQKRKRDRSREGWIGGGNNSEGIVKRVGAVTVRTRQITISVLHIHNRETVVE